jgi:hypothetical protein
LFFDPGEMFVMLAKKLGQQIVVVKLKVEGGVHTGA